MSNSNDPTVKVPPVAPHDKDEAAPSPQRPAAARATTPAPAKGTTTTTTGGTPPAPPSPPFDWKALANALRTAQTAVDATASAVEAIVPALAPEAAIVQQVISVALKVGAALADAQVDPLATLARIAPADGAVAGVESEWSSALDARFGPVADRAALQQFVSSALARGLVVPEVVYARLGLDAPPSPSDAPTPAGGAAPRKPGGGAR